MTAPKPKTCLHCNKEPARLPANTPKFCSFECSYLRADLLTGSQRWCYRHGEWHDIDDGCDSCLDEQHEEAAS